jgi:two-component system, cell cycle sensor histidine kinase and response regulator CckA
VSAHYERWPTATAVLDHHWPGIVSANGLSSMLADTDDDPVVVFDNQGTIVLANRPARALFDLALEQSPPVAVPLTSLAIHEHNQRLRAAVDDALGGESVRVVFTGQLPAAGMSAMVATVIPLREVGGERMTGGLVLLRVTRAATAGAVGADHRSSGDRLLRLAARLAHFDGWTLSIADETIRFRNDGATLLQDLWQDGCTIATVVDTMTPDGAASWQRALVRAIAEHSIFDVTSEHHGSDGRRVILRWTGKVELDQETGRPQRVTGIAQDITEIAVARDDRDVVERRLADTLGALSDGVMRFSDTRRLVYLNAAATEMVGHAQHEFLGLTPEEIFANVPPVVELIRAAEEQGHDGSQREQVLVHGDTEWLVTVYRVERSTTLLIRDVTDQQRAARSAEDAERELAKARRWEALGTLAGGLAHDLNNALTPIAIAAQLLARSELTTQQESAVSIIEKSSNRAKDMIAQVLSFADLGRASRGPLAVDELATEITEFSRGVMPPGVDLSVTVAPDLPIVEADATELYQVLTNLIVNARDAVADADGSRPRAVTVTFSSGAPRAHAAPWPRTVPTHVVRIQVTDTGSGMSAEIRERIFEPFFTTKRPGRGTGLGLPSAQRIVRASGGRLFVQSEEGLGTTCVVELPAAAASRDVVNPIDSEPAPDRAGHGRRVLLVDDEFAVLWAVEALLDESGYTVSTAETVEQAVRLLDRDGTYDAVITDLNLSTGSGLDVIRAVASRSGSTPVIVMTGSGVAEPIPAPLGTSVFRLLAKPFHPDELVDALAQAIVASTKDGS